MPAFRRSYPYKTVLDTHFWRSFNSIDTASIFLFIRYIIRHGRGELFSEYTRCSSPRSAELDQLSRYRR